MERISLLCRLGIDRIILREKDLSCEEYIALAEQVLAVCGRYPTECIIHKYWEAANVLHTMRLHLSVPDAELQKKKLASLSLLGLSVHSEEQLKAAERYSADYVIYGHVFPTECKKGLPARGLTNLKTICEKAEMPVYAIGGISPDNIGEVFAVGVAGVCVMSYGMQAKEKDLKEFIRRCHEM